MFPGHMGQSSLQRQISPIHSPLGEIRIELMKAIIQYPESKGQLSPYPGMVECCIHLFH